MNILILTYQGDLAGSTHSISYLAKGLATNGHAVYVGCRKESLLYGMFQGTSVVTVPMVFRAKLDIINMWHIYRVVKEHKIDIISAQSSLDRYTAGLTKLFFRVKAPIIHTRRQMPLSDGFFFQSWFYRQTTACIVAVSQSVKDGLVRLGMPEHHVRVIKNGTPKEKYILHNEESEVGRLRKEYNLAHEDTIIGCVSRRKDQQQLLKALLRIQTPLSVLLVGIVEDKELADIISNPAFVHRVIFTGEKNSKETLYHHKLMFLEVLPSTTEGLSQSLLEAMALGVPVIATNFAGNKDLITHGVNGLLFEHNDTDGLANQIKKLLENRELRGKLIEKGKETALRDFEISHVISKYETLFVELVK